MKKILFVLSVLTMVMVVGCSNPTNTVIIPPVVPQTPETPDVTEPETPVTPSQPETPAQPEQPQTPVTTEPETPTTVEPEAPVTTEPETPVTTQPETPATTEPEQPAEPQTPVVPEDKSPYEYVKPACVNLADYTYVGDYIFADTMNFAEWKYSNSETEYRLAFEKIARVKNDNPDTRIIRCNHSDPDTDVPVIKATKYKIYVKTTSVDGVENGHAVFSVWFGNIEESYDATKMKIIKVSDNSFTITVNGDYVGNISDYVAY